MKDFLVVGGHGFIGSHFCKSLEVGSFDIYDTGEPNGKPSDMIIESRKKGLPESIKVDGLLKNKYKYLVHFGSLAGVRNGNSKYDFIKRNCYELYGLLKVTNFEKLVYISSSSVLGDIETNYSISKKLAEDICRQYPNVIIRPFTVYGEHGRPEMFISKCIYGKKILVNGDPSKIKRRFTYVGDLVNCIKENLDSYGVINAVGEKSYSLLDILKLFGNKWENTNPSMYDFKEQSLDDAVLYLCKTRLEDFVNEIQK